jgi:hypothetical protein
MVEIRLPSGVTINAGWYPEGGADGEYHVKTRGKVDVPEFTTRDSDEAAQVITDLVTRMTLEGKYISS